MVKEFRINLNRQEGYAQREERKRRIRERIVLTVITLMVLAAGLLTFRADSRLRRIVANKEYQLERIVTQIDSLQRAGQNVSKEDVLALARLDDERVLWTRKLVAVADRMPEKMAITELKFERGFFELHALSPIEQGEDEFDKVKLLMDRLRATPLFMEDFADIKFKQSRRTERGEQELLSFSVRCELGAPGVRRSRRSAGRSGMGG